MFFIISCSACTHGSNLAPALAEVRFRKGALDKLKLVSLRFLKTLLRRWFWTPGCPMQGVYYICWCPAKEDTDTSGRTCPKTRKQLATAPDIDTCWELARHHLTHSDYHAGKRDEQEIDNLIAENMTDKIEQKDWEDRWGDKDEYFSKRLKPKEEWKDDEFEEKEAEQEQGQGQDAWQGSHGQSWEEPQRSLPYPAKA